MRANDPALPSLILMSKPGCHLCEPARDVVAQVCARLGVHWQERDVTSDPDWLARYGELIPVLLVDGRLFAYWRVDAQELERALTTVRNRS